MHREVVCRFGECAVVDHDHHVLNDEVHLVCGTPYAQDLVGGLLVHECHKSAFPSGHGVLTVCADRQQLLPPRTAKLVEQLAIILQMFTTEVLRHEMTGKVLLAKRWIPVFGLAGLIALATIIFRGARAPEPLAEQANDACHNNIVL
ncbi:unnamed protein product [Sphagnum tenellum]